jgi:hypothetical protein
VERRFDLAPGGALANHAAGPAGIWNFDYRRTKPEYGGWQLGFRFAF